jgi:coenzyme F420-reducing hydrogenase delta subunit
MKSGADGVVVGTACIEALFAHGNEGLRDNLQMISRALKASGAEAAK